MMVMVPGTDANKMPFHLPAVRRRKGAFMGETLTQSEQKAIADSLEENREALEAMAKH